MMIIALAYSIKIIIAIIRSAFLRPLPGHRSNLWPFNATSTMTRNSGAAGEQGSFLCCVNHWGYNAIIATLGRRVGDCSQIFGKHRGEIK